MKVIYSSTNSCRKEQFQIDTIILRDETETYVQKKAHSQSSIAHLNNLIRNTNTLMELNIPCSKILKTSHGQVTFEYLPGTTLNELLVSFILIKNKSSIIQLLQNYTSFINSICQKQKSHNTYNLNESNLPATIFHKISEKTQGEVYTTLPLLDLTFSNIKVKDNQNIETWKIFDQEWSSSIPIPQKYIIWRSVFPNFYYKYQSFHIDKLLSKSELLKLYNISIEEDEQYSIWEERFQIYTHSEWLRPELYEKERIPMQSFLNNNEQFFYDKHHGLDKNVPDSFLSKLIFRTHKFLKKLLHLFLRLVRFYSRKKKSYILYKLNCKAKLIKYFSFYKDKTYKINQFQNRPFITTGVCLFSHYDPKGEIDTSTQYYLQTIKDLGFDIVLITTSPILSKQLVQMTSKCCYSLIHRKNIGPDFGSWKSAIEHYGKIKSDKILLCNDSVIGPLSYLSGIIKRMDKKEVDIWSMTDSYEFKYHLQSYFLVFSSKVINSTSWIQFWQQVKLLKSRRATIYNYEMKIGPYFIDKGFSYAVAFPSESILPYLKKPPFKHFNPSTDYWHVLYDHLSIPLIKKSCYRDPLTKSHFPLKRISYDFQRHSKLQLDRATDIFGNRL